jgi:HlyD family secretion protein
MNRWVRRAGLVVLAAVILLALAYAFRAPAVEVDLVTVTRGPLRVTIDHEGRTRVKDRYVVSTPLAGSLRRIRLRAGDDVKAGSTVLAVLDPGDPSLLDARARAEAEARVAATQAAAKQAEVNVRRAEEALTLARKQLERVKAITGSSQEETDVAESRVRVAAEEVRAAQFAAKVAEYEHELAKAARTRSEPKSILPPEENKFEIRSPVDGKVLRVFQESAAVLPAGSRLLELGDPTDLEMEIDVLSTDAVKIPPQAKVVVERWGGPHPLHGRVRVVEPSAFLKVSALGVEEQRVNVVADFTDPPERRPTLGDAYRVETRIVTWESESVLKVPAGALFRRGDEWAAFAVRDGRAEVVPVRAGHSNGIDTEVLDGLSEGDQVVSHPSDRVKAGVRVTGR